MPYRMEISADLGFPSGQVRNVTAGFTGTDQITLSGGIAGGGVGDVIQVRGASSGNRNYVIIESVSSTVKRVQPTPPSIGGPGSATAQGIDRPSDEFKVASGLVTSYPATNQIQRVGANFVTNGVKPNDLAILGPGGSSTNEGVHVVASVIDENNITVRTNTLSTGLVSGDTIIIARPNSVVLIEDEAAATMAALIAGLTFDQPNWGVVGDYLNALGVEGAGIDPGVGEAYTIDGILEFRLVSTDGTTVTTFSLTNEVLINLRAGDQNIGASRINTVAFNAEVISGSVASPMLLNLGTRPGDELSGRNGALLYGVTVGPRNANNRWSSDQFAVQMRSSAVKTRRKGDNVFVTIDGATELYTSLVEGQALSWPANPGSAGALSINSLHHITEQALGVFRGDADISNLVIDSSLGQFLAGAINAVIEGILKSDVSNQPLYLLFGSSGARFLNPRADYPLAELGAEFFAGTSPNFGKSYTFNPTFLSRDLSGSIGVPIPGLVVEISEINQTTQIAAPITGSPFTTDASGRINAGVGVELDRQKLVGTAITDFRHRIEVEGPAFRRLDQIFTITQPFTADVAVDFLQPDFEGEFST